MFLFKKCNGKRPTRETVTV